MDNGVSGGAGSTGHASTGAAGVCWIRLHPDSVKRISKIKKVWIVALLMEKVTLYRLGYRVWSYMSKSGMSFLKNVFIFFKILFSICRTRSREIL